VNSSLNQFDNILADAFEAVTAALAIDAGEEKAKKWLSQVFQKDFQMGPETLIRFDTKGKVQQWIQSVLNQPPVYKTIGTVGTPQETQFIVAAFVGDYEIARATAKSKREASKKVAIKILDMIESNELTKEKMMNYFGKEK
jgi:ribonuclease-3